MFLKSHIFASLTTTQILSRQNIWCLLTLSVLVLPLIMSQSILLATAGLCTTWKAKNYLMPTHAKILNNYSIWLFYSTAVPIKWRSAIHPSFWWNFASFSEKLHTRWIWIAWNIYKMCACVGEDVLAADDVYAPFCFGNVLHCWPVSISALKWCCMHCCRN